MNFRKIIACFCLSGLLTTPSFADFHYQETTRITGGALVGMIKVAGTFSKDAKRLTEPVVSTVLVQGNRMAHINPDATQIVDLDKETITRIDHEKKQYTVITFEQMRQQLAEARTKAEQPSTEPREQQQQDSAQDVKMDFKVTVRNTEGSKNVAGLDTKEAILSMVLQGTHQQTGEKGALAFTNDMWNAPEIPGYAEVRDFNQRFAAKMGMMFSGALRPSLAALQPGAAEGMAESSGDQGEAQNATQSVLLESTTELTGFSSDPIAASQFEVPAGYKLVSLQNER